MSPLQFQSDIADWLVYLQAIGLAAKLLSIEITEGLLLNANDDVKNKPTSLQCHFETATVTY